MSVISVRAARAASKLGRTVSIALGASELTPAGYRLLAYLATGETAAKVLAAKLAVSRPTVTATLDWLEPRGYVTRTPDPVDGRRVEIAITPAGQAALDAADRMVADRLGAIVAGLDADDIGAIVTGLEVLGEALNVDRARNIGMLVGTEGGSGA